MNANRRDLALALSSARSAARLWLVLLTICSRLGVSGVGVHWRGACVVVAGASVVRFAQTPTGWVCHRAPSDEGPWERADHCPIEAVAAVLPI